MACAASGSSKISNSASRRRSALGCSSTSPAPRMRSSVAGAIAMPNWCASRTARSARTGSLRDGGVFDGSDEACFQVCRAASEIHNLQIEQIHTDGVDAEVAIHLIFSPALATAAREIEDQWRAVSCEFRGGKTIRRRVAWINACCPLFSDHQSLAPVMWHSPNHARGAALCVHHIERGVHGVGNGAGPAPGHHPERRKSKIVRRVAEQGISHSAAHQRRRRALRASACRRASLTSSRASSTLDRFVHNV